MNVIIKECDKADGRVFVLLTLAKLNNSPVDWCLMSAECPGLFRAITGTPSFIACYTAHPLMTLEYNIQGAP